MITRQIKFEAIGTIWNISIISGITATTWTRLRRDIDKRIEEFDKTYSRFRKDSLVTKMSIKAGDYAMPKDGYRLLSYYENLYRSTDGLVTPLIGQTLVDAGYDAEYSFKSKKLSTPPEWDDVISYSHDKITIKRASLLDFGAAGKGYLVDIISEIIKSFGIKDFVVNAGGDMLHHSVGTKIAVGLENPLDPTEVVGEADIGNESLCASSGNRRKWGSYNHNINPDTLISPTSVTATWVIAKDTMTADGLATALFFVQPSKLRDKFKFSYGLLIPDMEMVCSNDFPVRLYQAGAL